jgi:RHS repeat-associated protein
MESIASDRVQVSEAAGFEPDERAVKDMHEKLAMNVSITEPGYIYAWVSNASENTKVWFDDFSVAHTSNFVTQATDYEAWGDVLREQKTDESIYRYSYQGQFAEKDQETGWSAFEARMYDALIGRWTTRDPKRQFYSPYLSMGNNPANAFDPDGRDVILLNNKNGANGMGHAAILVSKGDVWYLYSKNGTATHGMFGESFDFQDGKKVGSLDDFFNGQYNKDEDGNTLYDRALLIHTDAETDAAIIKAASAEVKSYYMVIGSTCQDTWNCALDEAGLDFYQGHWPNDDFWFMQKFMTIGDKVERLPVPSIEIGPLIPLKEGEVFNPDDYED